MNATPLAPDRRPAGYAPGARADEHAVADRRSVDGALARTQTPRSNMERAHLEKASACQRRPRGDARRALGGGGGGPPPTLIGEPQSRLGLESHEGDARAQTRQRRR